VSFVVVTDGPVARSLLLGGFRIACAWGDGEEGMVGVGWKGCKGHTWKHIRGYLETNYFKKNRQNHIIKEYHGIFLGRCLNSM
jgi:hypothetical protein